MHLLLHSVPLILKQATFDPCLCWRLLDTHRQVWVSLLWGHCSFILGPGAHSFVCALQESVSPVLCKFWPLYGGVNGTSSKRAYAIPRSTAPRALAPTAVHYWPIPPQETLKHSSVSVSRGSGSWCTQGMFEPSEGLWRVWGLIVNVILPLLLSCWSFSLALGGGIPPQGRSSTTQPLVQHHAATAPVPPVLLGLLCPWTWGVTSQSQSRQTGIGQTGVGKREHQHFSNQRTKMERNG